MAEVAAVVQCAYWQIWRRGRRENGIVCHWYGQGVAGGLRTAALCVVAVAATSCTNAVTSGTTSTARTTSTIDAADPRPLITETSLALMAYWNPSDLSNVYVYPDRSAIVVSRKPEGSDSQTLVASRFTLDQAEFDKVVRAAHDAGLVGGGVPPAVSLPPGIQVADGSRVWYSFREGDSTTTRVVDQPGSPMDGTAARTAFAPLVKIMSSLSYPPRAGSTDVPLTRWVITATRTSEKPVPEKKPALRRDKSDRSCCPKPRQTAPALSACRKRRARWPFRPRPGDCAAPPPMREYL